MCVFGAFARNVRRNVHNLCEMSCENPVLIRVRRHGVAGGALSGMILCLCVCGKE